MKALVYLGPKQVEVQDLELADKGENELLVKVKYCGVCGSDQGIFLGTHPRAKAPLVLGHEVLGEVLEDEGDFKKGDRVVTYPLISCGKCLPCRTGNEHVCNTLKLIGIDQDGGMREKMYLDKDCVFKVPEGVSDKVAVTVEPLAVLLRAIHQSEFKTQDTAVVIGAGPIGLLAGIVLKYSGASKVFISDIIDERLETARKLGLNPVNSSKQDLVEIVKDHTDGEGADCLIECSGAEAAAMQMTQVVRVGGGIVMASVHKQPHTVNLQELNFKEQWLIGSRVYTKQEFKQAVDLLTKLSDDLERVVTHIVPLSEADRVFELINNPSEGTAKVIVDCQA